MPIYATVEDLYAAYGITEVSVSSDNENNDGGADARFVAVRSASREIESYADPYGLVPTDVTADAQATAGTFPAWWIEACLDIAMYRFSLTAGVQTKEKTKRYERWLKRFDDLYPSMLEDGTTPMGGGQTVTIVAGGEREFSASKVVGL